MELLLYYGLFGCLALLILASIVLRHWTGGSLFDIAGDVIFGALIVTVIFSGLLIGLPWLEVHGVAFAGF